MVSFDLNSVDILTAVVQYFGLKHCGKVSLVGSMATLVTPTKGNVEGMMPILAHLHQDGNTAVLGETVAESCMARQWIQFKVKILYRTLPFWLSVGSPISPDVRPRGRRRGAKILSQF